MSGNPLGLAGHRRSDFGAGAMLIPHALAALAALGQPTRLSIFRLLLAAEPGGLSAGALADGVGCPHNTLSTHVAILVRAGLVRGARDGRTITYRADASGTRALISFLVHDCCNGRPELCSLVEESAAACQCPPLPRTDRKRRVVTKKRVRVP
jgi:ArsR family transcriptional regulator, arsenate/arsenite/antimonite-responsive transcriptional repressor